MPYRLFVAVVSLVLFACGGEAPEDPSPADNPPAADETPIEQAKVDVCSAEGVAASCDPLTNEGCAEGSCYIVANKGPACVCPAGTAEAGGECNTTSECAPKHGCIGEIAPGSCSPYCDRSKEGGCPTGFFCDKIKQHPTFGVCAPNPA